MLFGGDFLTLADECGVDLAADVSHWWSGFYREHFPGRTGEVLRYRGPTGYRQAIAQNPGHKVVSPHPFDSAHCPAERWYLADPGLAVRLNDKGRLPGLSDRVLRHETLGPDAFALDHWREDWPLPFAVKLTEPSGGGDGVALCRRERDLKEARRRFAGREVKVERLVEEIRHNYNVQLEVSPEGQIRYIGGSVQRVQGGRYAGNVIDPDWLPPPQVAEVCDGAARVAAGLGWHGVCGLDLIEDEGGEVWLIDPNFRLNGSTPFFLLGDYLKSRHRRPQLLTGYFCYPGTPTELFAAFRREIHRRELVAVGAHWEPGEGTTRIYAAAVSDSDPQAHEGLLRGFAAKGLRAGIGLRPQSRAPRPSSRAQ
jgi:hypothetical protein